ncbi:MAG: hypothetical protein ACFFDK_04055 [Promethearchaeota archaeon]
MTSDSFILNKKSEKNYSTISSHKRNFEEVIKKLNQIINALGEFKNNYNKKFNFSKLMKYLMIPESEIDNLTSLILYFQEIFNNTFNNHYLKKKVIDKQVYLVTEPILDSALKEKSTTKQKSHEIHIQKAQSKLFSDFIYTFKHVKRGKGFDLENNGTELLKNLRILSKVHPYLFKQNGNNLTYPSAIGLKLGEMILSLNKCKKNITNIELEQYNFIFD